ncbi:hypothetical protein ACQ86E_30300 [Bradyrhizobium betae]|uniref:hypothetical protein n=1 Tax=Bradyrhizobium betae TaxID=244734 RepID=UPI003D67CE60
MLDYLLGLAKSIDWKAAGGIVFGAAISATVAYILQRNSFAEARRQKAVDKREERLTLGLNVFTKMMRIASTLEILKRSLREAFDRAEKAGLEMRPWAVVMPLANLPAKVHFEPKELTEIMKLDFNLFNDLGPFDDIHNSLLDIFQTYKADRIAMTTTMPADMTGILGKATFTPDEMRRLGPKMAALDTIIDGLLQRTAADSDEAWSILKRLQASLNKEYGLKLSLEMKPDTRPRTSA